MELKDFIKNVLSDITEAIQECQDGKSSPAVISPSNVGNGGDFIMTPSGKIMINKIDFEVTVSAEMGESTSGEVKGMINVISAAIGSKVGTSSTGKDESTTKIKFSIPVIYPSVPVDERSLC